MGETFLIRVDVSMVQTLEDIRIKIAEELKKKYNLKEVTVYGSLASQVLAAAYNNKKVSFKINKVSLNKGIVNCSNTITF
jgi:hypothetical protein